MQRTQAFVQCLLNVIASILFSTWKFKCYKSLLFQLLLGRDMAAVEFTNAVFKLRSSLESRSRHLSIKYKQENITLMLTVVSKYVLYMFINFCTILKIIFRTYLIYSFIYTVIEMTNSQLISQNCIVVSVGSCLLYTSRCV